MICKTSTGIWDMFMNVTLQAAVHLGQDCTENLRSTKNQPLKSARQSLQTTARLITDRTEFSGKTTIDWKQPMWRETTLVCDRAFQIANSQNLIPKSTSFLTQCYVWEVSVLNQSKLGKTGSNGFLETRHLKDLDRIDGEQMEFEWNYLPRIHHIENSWRDSKDDDGIKVWTRAIQRKDHLHVDVLWHCIARTRKQR